MTILSESEMLTGQIQPHLPTDLQDYCDFALIEGSISVVKAVHRKTQSTVAIQVLEKEPDELLTNSLENSRNELQILMSIDHPTIARSFEVIETPTTLYHVMEYVGGPSFLSLILQEGRIYEVQGRLLFNELVHAIVHLHDRHNIIHGNIKLENIILVAPNWPKLTCFGLSGIGINCCSLAYAAPELFCKSVPTKEVDIWALGVVLYTMIAGEMPFMESESFPQIAGSSPELNDLLGRMLTKDPIHRITARDILKHPWLCPASPWWYSQLHCAVRRSDAIDEEACATVSNAFGASCLDCVDQVLNHRNSSLAVAYKIMVAGKETKKMREKSWSCPLLIGRNGGKDRDTMSRPAVYVATTRKLSSGMAKRMRRANVGSNPELWGQSRLALGHND
jgi:serine/threonine protein kinase